MAGHQVRKCAHCGSMEVMANVRQLQCLQCGKCTWYGSGRPVLDPHDFDQEDE